VRAFGYESKARDAPVRSANARAGSAQRRTQQALLAQTDEGAHASRQVDAAARTGLVPIEDERLPTKHIGKLGTLATLGLSIGPRRFFGSIRRRREITRFVATQLVLDGLVEALAPVARRLATTVPTAMPAASGAFGLPTHAIARGLRFVQHVVENPANVFGHGLHHGEDLFEHVAYEVRCGHPQIFGQASDVVRELLRDPGVKNPLLASAVPMAMPAAMAVAMLLRSALGIGASRVAGLVARRLVSRFRSILVIVIL
jgi:hypothetical protein